MQAAALSLGAAPGRLTRVKAPGTCGELVQGAIDGRDFLVNCPVDLFSHASVRASAAPGLHLEDPRGFAKAAAAIGLVARERGLDLGHEVAIESAIPRGKGMASSTADISAALEAVCRISGVSLSGEEFARIITAVEPSDCVHFPGVAHVNHLTGELHESLPTPDGLRVLVVDCGGEVDTVGFDRERARRVYRKNQPRIAGALELLRRGLRWGNKRAVAEAATASAELSQEILPKPQFGELLGLARDLGALGVNCAHSGTVLGVLHDLGAGLGGVLARRVQERFGADLAVLGDFRVIGGGCREF